VNGVVGSGALERSGVVKEGVGEAERRPVVRRGSGDRRVVSEGWFATQKTGRGVSRSA
jgi:hypothetical protein